MALNTRSALLKSTTAATCAMLARMLRWLSTTPFGAPSEPLVNSTTAGASAARRAPGRRRAAWRPASRAAWPPARARRARPPATRTAPALHPRHRRAELAALDEGARRQHGGHLGRRAGGEHALGPGGEVQHRRHPAERLQRHERHHGAVRVRQHHADWRAARRLVRQPAAEHGGAQHHAAIGQRRAGDVLDDRHRRRRTGRARPAGPRTASGSVRRWRRRCAPSRPAGWCPRRGGGRGRAAPGRRPSATGGSTVSDSRGNQRRGARPPMRDSLVNCSPSMRTGRSRRPPCRRPCRRPRTPSSARRWW